MKFKKLFLFFMPTLIFGFTVYTARKGHCKFCGECKASNLARHENYRCKKNPKLKSPQSGVCPFCGEWKENVSHHEQYNCNKNPHKLTKKRGGFCRYCDEWKVGLHEHERYYCNQNPHKLTRKRGGFCKHCDEWKDSLHEHEQYYCNKNPHKTPLKSGGQCQFCKKQFTQLKKHEKRCALNPASSKQKICPHCNKTFKRLKSHLRYCKERREALAQETLAHSLKIHKQKPKSTPLSHSVEKIVQQKLITEKRAKLKSNSPHEKFFSDESIGQSLYEFDQNPFNDFDGTKDLLLPSFNKQCDSDSIGDEEDPFAPFGKSETFLYFEEGLFENDNDSRSF